MEHESVQGVEVPALGLGTARMTGSECHDAVATALELGYRHVDTAQMYDNEDAVGAAIADAAVERGDVFLVTKILRSNLASEELLRSFEDSLERLRTDYVDLLLIHAPSRTVPVEESLQAMNELQDQGKVEHVGVSNFSVAQMREAIQASETPILTNQVEYHPFERQDDILEFCIENDILLTAYSPLNKGRLSDPTLTEIGERYGKTPAQVALRWLIQQDAVAAIPKAARRTHMEQNLDVFDFRLTDEEMEQLFQLGSGLPGRLRSLLGI